MSTETDLFAGGGSPSLSWKDKPIGTTVTGTVTEAPKLVQSRDFETGEPAFWPAGRDGQINPKMAVVLAFEVGGEALSVWAVKPSAMFAAIASAQKNAGGHRIDIGDTLTITYAGDKPNENPRLNAAKQYTATVTVGDKFADPTPVPAAVHNQQPYVAPTAANAGTQGQAAPAAPADSDFAATADKVKGMGKIGMTPGQIAPLVGLPLETVAAILAAPAA